MSVKVSVRPQLLRWARERAALTPADLARKVGLQAQRIEEWERTGEIALAHLERLASKTYTPLGYFFLPEPPPEELPIDDFRTAPDPTRDRKPGPSPELLDTIYECQRRQGWFRDYLIEQGEEPLQFVGSATLDDPPEEVANRIREALELKNEVPASLATRGAALTWTVERAQAARILVMRNSVVGDNTHRKLNVEEFRGFALSDDYAPLIFINSADAESAQRFTLAHELAHIWLGHSGVSDARLESHQTIEGYCNTVAAELLVPLRELAAAWRHGHDPAEQVRRLAERFKVSSAVILIRARDAACLPADQFERLYQVEAQRTPTALRRSGGNYYRRLQTRLDSRFARAVVASALAGRITYKEAFRLLGIRKQQTFEKLANALGIAD